MATSLVRGREGEIEVHYTEPRGVATLWFGFLGGAAARKLQLMVNYALVPFACWHNLSITIHLASPITWLIAIAAGGAAYGSWKETGGDPFGSGDEGIKVSNNYGRSRLMAVSGLIMSAFFTLLILGQWIPNLRLSPCLGID